ncbi:MAG: DUF5916 domain-containing protein [Gemmatimonadaceae bacterium]
MFLSLLVLGGGLTLPPQKVLASGTPVPRGPSVPLTAIAVRTRQAPVVDGRNNDPIWRDAPKISDFRQFAPHVNVDPSFRTEFQTSYDEHNLYVFVRMYDPHPDSIMHALSRRDVRGPSDQIKILIDSYGDRRSGYEFAVNPDGVKRDYSISNDAQEDDSWNGVWDVATTVDSLGWTAEFRIPLSQLRYGKSERHTFGFGVWRDIERLVERDSWPLYSPERNGLASQLGKLDGISGISTAQRLEVTPYAVTKNVERTRASGFARGQDFSAGADVKFGLTPNVTLDATVNPDFGQVEADPAVLNLSAFETFYAEKRPFFVEGTGLYQFQLNCYIVVDCSTNEGLFYSRRIGRSPMLRDYYGDASTPTATPIAAATKLTGRTGNGLSFGVLDAATPRVDGLSSRTVEPRTNYAVVRAQQDLRGGEAGISIIGTAVNRALDEWTSPYIHSSAYTGGATFRNRFYHSEYELSGQLAVSQVMGSPEAIDSTQRSAVHYFQQPGDKITEDPTRTSLGGHAEQLKFGKYGGGFTRFESSILRQSPGFEVNDLGYLRRADIMDWSTWAALSFQNAHGIYRWAQVNGNHWEQWNTSGTRLDNAFNFNGHMGLLNNWDVHLGSTFARLTPSYCDRCTRGGPVVRQSAAFYPWGGVNTDSRKPISAGMWANLNFSDGGRTHGTSLSPYMNFRFSTRLQAQLGSNVFWGQDNTQWFGNFTDAASATHYTFAHLDQTQISLSTQLSYAMTRDLTLEFYGQPFVAKGVYTNIRETSATPNAAGYDDRFRPFTAPAGTDTAFKSVSLRSNMVVRWEYRPGSTVYLVWTHGRGDDENTYNTGQSWLTDYRDLFRLHPDNTFLIKVAYWLNR